MTITDSARRLALVAVVAMLAALLPLSGAFAQDDPEVPAEDEEHGLELSGESAAEIAQAWSELAYPDDAVAADAGPTEALLGRSDLFADNLASGSLQGGTDNGRPLLLTDTDALDQIVIDELERLGGPDAIETVHILGGIVAISEDVADELADLGYTTARVEGETRTETAIDIAATAFADADTALLVRSTATSDDDTQEFADSLGAGAWAAEAGVPVLFTQTDTLTGTTADYLADSSIESVIIVGGDSAVSGDVQEAVDAIVGDVSRVEGDTRFTTAIAVNDARELGGDAAIVVDGQEDDAWVNGFAAANVSGNNGFPLVLSNLGELPEASETYLEGFYADEPAFANAHLTLVRLICGTNAGAACGLAAAIAGVTVYPYPFPDAPVVDENSGIIVSAVSPDYSFVTADGTVVDVETEATDTFMVDGALASQAVFFLNATNGDEVTLTPATEEDAAVHALTNVDPDSFTEGMVGNVDTTLGTLDIIEPNTGVTLRDGIDYTGALYTVDGALTIEVAFDAAVSEGDGISIDEDEVGNQTFNLTNAAITGMVTDFDTNLSDDFMIDGIFGDTAEDAALLDEVFILDDVTYAQTYMVDGEDATLAEILAAITDGDQVTYDRTDGDEEFSLINAAPTTQTGIVDENGDPLLENVQIVLEDGDTFFYDYSALPVGIEVRYIVDGVLVAEGDFDTAYTPGDSLMVTPHDEALETDAVLALTNQNLSGIVDVFDFNVTPADGGDFNVVDANGTIIVTMYAYPTPPGSRLFLDDVEVDEADFETEMTGVVEADGYTVEIVEGLAADEVRVTTPDA